MSTVSGTTSSATTTNPYAILNSTNDLMATEDPLTASTSSTSKTSSSNNSSSSSGSYSQDLVSSMSGLDVNSMVTQMMQSDQIKLNLLLQSEQKTQWTQDKFRSTITNLTNFKSNYFNVLSSNNLLSSSKYSTNAVNSTNTAVTATASNDAQAGSYSISWTQLATVAKLDNVGGAVAGLGLNSSSTATDLANKIGGSGSLSFTVNGKDVTYDLKSAANANKTVKQVMSDLSSQSGATFSYSELTGRITASSSDTGSSQALAISWKQSDTDTAAFMGKAFGLSSSNTTAGTDSLGNATYNYTVAGKDGSFTITEPDSSSSTVTSSSNKLSYDGVTYNIASSAGNSGTSTINVSTDSTSIVNKIQGFVTDYNNLIGAIQDATNEKKDYSYKPLTSAQEASMTTDQITAWNKKAQQGLLSNDSTLTSMLTEMRQALYTTVNGTGLTMKDLGLSTSNDETQGGKLTFTSADLTKTLQSKPQQVIDAFTKVSTSVPSYNPDLSSSQRASRSSEEGIFQRLSDIVEEYAGTSIDKSGNQGKLLIKAGTAGGLSEFKNTLYKDLKREKDSVTNFKVKMANDKKMYTAKFTALQSALSAMSSQQSYLSQMLSSSSSN